MGREEHLLAESIGNTLGLAQVAADRLGSIAEGVGWNFDVPNDEYMEVEDELEAYLEKSFRDVAILAERLGLPVQRQKIDEEYLRAKAGNFASVQPDSFVGSYSPSLEKIRPIFLSLSIITDSTAITGLDTLKTILEHTGTILLDRQIEPTKEKEVQDAVQEVLRYAFNDVVPKPTIGHVLKHYIPDLGVRSLLALVEFKFADSLGELKTHLDQLYADMKGYSGADHWRTYFAVLYQTDNFSTQGEVDAAFEDVGADISWIPILITGRGGRPPKEAPSDISAPANRRSAIIV